MNIFDSIVDSPIALGAITGILEMADAGLTAQKKEAIAKEKKRVENEASFIDYLKGDSEAARIFMNQPSSYGMMSNLAKTNIYGFNSILLSASKAPKLSEIDKKIMDQMSASPTFAKNYIFANPKLAKENPNLYKFGVVSGIGNTMSSTQSQTYNDLIKGGLENVKQYMSTVFPDKVIENDQGEIESRYPPQTLNNSLFHALNAFVVSKSNEVPTVELSDTNINTLRDKLSKADPSQVANIIAKFREDTGNLDFKSNAFVNMAGLVYGSRKGDDFKGKINSLAQMIKDVDGTIGDANENKVLAETVKDVMKEIKGNEDKYLALGDSKDPKDQKAYTSYRYIKSLHNQMSLLGKSNDSRYTYGKVDLSSFAKDKDPQTDPAKGLAYLRTVNDKINSGELDVSGMGEKDRANFISDINNIMQNVHLDATKTKVVGLGANAKSERGLPFNFNVLTPELMKIDQVSNFVENTLGLGGEGDDTDYVMPPQVGSDNTELGENKIKLNDGFVYQLSPETISFAQSKNMSPLKLFKDKGYRKILTSGDGITSNGVRMGSDATFKHINKLKESGIVVGDTEITEKNAKKLARFFIVNDINEPGDQYDIIAALKSDKLPSAWANKEPYRIGLSASALEAGSKQLAGQTYDIKKLPQLVQSSDAFAAELEAVINYLEATPTKGSQFVRDFYSFFLNQALLSGSTLDVASGNIANLISVDTVAGNTVEEREAEQNRLNQTFTEIMRSDFAKNNALINSTFISLAYNYARTKDPNGRISDADFKFAYNALTGGFTTPKQVSISVLQEFLVEAKAKQALLANVNEHFSRYDNNTNTVTIQKDNVRGLRALKDFKKISLLTRQVSNIKEYVKSFETNPSLVFGTNSRYTKKRTRLTNMSGQRLSGVYEVGLLSADKRSSVPLAGSIPLYVKEDGTPLTLIELNALRAAQ